MFRSTARFSTASLRAAALASALAGLPMIAAAAPKSPPPVYTPPAKSDADAATKPAATAPAGPVLAEGTLLADRVGRLQRDDDSPLAQLTLQPEKAGSHPQTIAVAPNQMLRAMEENADSGPADFRVTGRVTLYRGRNLLMVETASKSDAAAHPTTTAAASAPAAPAPTTRPSTTPATAPDRTASADQLLGDLLKSPARSGVAAADAGGQPLRKPEAPPETDATSGKGAVKPGAPAVAVLREGTYLVDRLGRLTRSADGSTAEFTFESDGAALQDPPVVIVPNLKLMAMEDAANAINRDLRFRITGMVTEYRGRNYVLLEKAVVVPDATQQLRGTQQ